MKKRLILIAIILLVVSLFATGCENVSSKTTISYTYKVDTGDNIKITLITNDGYSLSSDLPFVISKDKKEESQGIFIAAEYYDAYVESVEQDEKAKILDSGDTDTISYVMWNYSDSEFNYVIKINGTNTGMLLVNNVSEESAKECFSRLEIKVEE